MAEKLLELETISRRQVEEIMEAHGIPAREGDEDWRMSPDELAPAGPATGEAGPGEVAGDAQPETAPPLPPNQPVEQS